jgi:hypothetical protein
MIDCFLFDFVVVYAQASRSTVAQWRRTDGEAV